MVCQRIIFEASVPEREGYGFLFEVGYGYGKRDVNSTEVSNLAKSKYFRTSKFDRNLNIVCGYGEMVKMELYWNGG